MVDVIVKPWSIFTGLEYFKVTSLFVISHKIFRFLVCLHSSIVKLHQLSAISLSYGFVELN
jgi:hypothetical protein